MMLPLPDRQRVRRLRAGAAPRAGGGKRDVLVGVRRHGIGVAAADQQERSILPGVPLLWVALPASDQQLGDGHAVVPSSKSSSQSPGLTIVFPFLLFRVHTNLPYGGRR